jgi:hypothetical protein
MAGGVTALSRRNGLFKPGRRRKVDEEGMLAGVERGEPLSWVACADTCTDADTDVDDASMRG